MKKIRYLPFGYTIRNGHTVVEQQEADIVRNIFKAYIQGASLKEIAEDLTAKQIPYTERTCVWDKARISRILENAKYTGDEEFETIIDENIYEEAAAVKSARRWNQAVEESEGIRQIRDRIRCGQCGATMLRHINSKRAIRESWTCSNADCGIRVRISDGELLRKITLLMNRVIANADLMLPHSKVKHRDSAVVLNLQQLSRRNSLRLQSDKTAVTANGRYSKYALTEVLHCAECGSRYKRVTWNIRGKKKIVWRCVSRLDYGKKYCKNSITAEEEALHGAVVRALKLFHAEDESTYLTLMKATIGEAIGINGGSEEIDLLTRRIDTLNKRMLDLVNETVAAGKDVESSEDEFKGISDQIEQLNRRIAAIQESIHKDGSRQARLEEIQNIIAERNANETQYDDSIVRQMIECIKVHNDGKQTIIFGGGYEIEETL